MPGRRSISCIGSKVTFLCGLVCLSTGLTGWVNSFWLSSGSVTVFAVVVVVVVVFFVDVVDWLRVIGNTVLGSRNILSNFSLFYLLFQQARLIYIIFWFFYSDGTLVWVRRRWCFRFVGSQSLFVARQELPNHSTLIPSLGV